MNKKLQREQGGPSWTEVILGAALSLVLGAALAAAFLMLKPVSTVRELPKEPADDVVYHLEGSRDAAKARPLPAKQAAFLRGESVELVEEELNAFAAAASATAAQKAEAGATKTATAGAPNFRIRDGVLQIALPVQLAVAGIDRRVVVQARGGFVQEGGVFVFEPAEMWVGSCPLQRLPLVQGILMDRLLASLAVPEDVAAAWRGLSSVTVEEATLRLVR